MRLWHFISSSLSILLPVAGIYQRLLIVSPQWYLPDPTSASHEFMDLHMPGLLIVSDLIPFHQGHFFLPAGNLAFLNASVSLKAEAKKAPAAQLFPCSVYLSTLSHWTVGPRIPEVSFYLGTYKSISCCLWWPWPGSIPFKFPRSIPGCTGSVLLFLPCYLYFLWPFLCFFFVFEFG